MLAAVSTPTSGNVRRFGVPVYFVDPAKTTTMQYLIAQTGHKQAHLRRRFVIEPEIDLGAYRVIALIDYITLTIALRNPSQSHVVHRVLAPHVSGTVRVEPLDLNRSSARRFEVTFNEPKRAEVEKALSALEAARPFSDQPLLSKLEVAADWYFRSELQTIEPLAKIAAVLQQHLVPPHFDYTRSLALPRVVYPEIDDGGEIRSQVRKLIVGSDKSPKYSHTFVDGTNYVGARGSSAMWRIMIKTTDDRKSLTEFRPLPPEQWRARIEVVLSGSSLDGLGIHGLGDLVGFRFERLRRDYFSHWLTTIPAPAPTKEEYSEWVIEARRVFRAFRDAGGLAAQREELAVLARRRKLLALHRGSSAAKRRLRLAEATLSRRRGYRLEYRSLNAKIDTALRSLKW